ncbi:MAG: winged helix-turn-helix domain-containing protein, partial [Anaerolineales bacterium]
MSTFNCYLFGRFRAHCNQQPVTSFHSQKALELLCFLLLNRDRPYHREILAEVLWGENRDRSKAYLRKAIWQLQKSLSAIPDLVEDNLLQVDPEWLQIKADADIWTDAGTFEAAYTSVLEIYGNQFHEQQFTELQSTVDLYQGDLLEGWYEDWCVFERERFKEMYLVMI